MFASHDLDSISGRLRPYFEEHLFFDTPLRHDSFYKLSSLKVPKLILQSSDLNQNIVIIGDVHGQSNALKRLLKQIPSNSSIFCVGDLVDKGPNATEVIDICIEYEIRSVMGNHDINTYRNYRSSNNKIIDDGFLDRTQVQGTKYNSSIHNFRKQRNIFSNKHIDYLQMCPIMIGLPCIDSIIVHAGVNPLLDDPLNFENPEVDPLVYLFIKRVRTNKQGSKSISCFNRIDHLSHNQKLLYSPWVMHYNGSVHVYFGHDSARNLQQYPRATGLDTGAGKNKALSAVIINQFTGERAFIHVDIGSLEVNKTIPKY